MDLLNYYDSDDGSASNVDTRAENVASVSAAAKVAVKKDAVPVKTTQLSTTTTSNNQATKKRKVIDISFLPQHIQNALLHGDSALDSDAEDDNEAKTRNEEPHVPVSKKQAKGPSEVIDPLIAMLPAPSNPKHAKEASAYQFTTVAPRTKTTTNLQPPAYQSSSSTHQMNKYDDDNEEYEIESPRYQPAQQHYYQQETEQEEYDPNPAMSSQSKNKRHQREVEQMLMAGDLSAIDTSAIAEVSGQKHWNQMEYTDKMQREALIIKQYTQDGTIKSAMQPTKLQNRRHQLTSMAMKAAETEIAMLDSQTAKGRNKTQSKAKYGW